MFSFGTKIGLYIDSKKVCVAEISQRAGAYAVEHTAQSPLLTGLDISAVGAAVQKAFDKAGIASKKVNLALPAEETIVRCFQMPYLPKKEIDNAVRFEAQKYVPFDIKDLHYDFEVFPDKKASRMTVMFMAVKKKVADNLRAILEGAGFVVATAEPLSFSMLRAFHPVRSQSATAEAFALIALSAEGAVNVMIAKGEMLLIARHTHLPKSPETGDLSMESALSEITLSFDYFAKNFKSDEIRRIDLCMEADNAAVQRWSGFLHNEFGVPIQTLSLERLYGKTGAELLGTSIAVGAALKGGANARNGRLNFFPKREAVEGGGPIAFEERKTIGRWALAELVLAALLFAAAYFMFSGRVSTKNADLQRLTEAYPSSKYFDNRAKIEDLSRRQAILKRRIDTLSNLIEKRTYLTTKLDRLAKLLPENIQLTGLDYSDSEDWGGQSSIVLTLKGQLSTREGANSISLVNRLVSLLGEDKEFMLGLDEVTLGSVQRSAADEAPLLRFVIECVTAKRSGYLQ